MNFLMVGAALILVSACAAPRSNQWRARPSAPPAFGPAEVGPAGVGPAGVGPAGVGLAGVASPVAAQPALAADCETGQSASSSSTQRKRNIAILPIDDDELFRHERTIVRTQLYNALRTRVAPHKLLSLAKVDQRLLPVSQKSGERCAFQTPGYSAPR